MARTGWRHTSLRRLLAGGDRRSIAGANRVLSIVRAQPERIHEMATLTEDEDWLVSMRALDVLEKVAHEHPDRIRPFKKILIGPLAETDRWEMPLQIVRSLPLMRWSAQERARAVEICESGTFGSASHRLRRISPRGRVPTRRRDGDVTTVCAQRTWR